MGDPVHNLARARKRLGGIFDVQQIEASPIYRTEPQLVRSQPWFANQVVRLQCGPTISALSLLRTLLALELALGRDRTQGEGAPKRFGPRVIDLDLLVFGDTVMNSEELTLPHPRMHERAFVMVPLHDLAGDLSLPDGRNIANCLQQLEYRLDGDKIFQD